MTQISEIISNPIVVAAITGIPSFFCGRWLELHKSKINSDKESYRHLRSRLPGFARIQYFFHESSMTDSFSTDTFREFGMAFTSAVDNPEQHFLDRELYECVQKIATLYNEMAQLVARETFPVPLPGVSEQTIRRKKWGDPEDDWVTGELLNEKAAAIYAAFTDFLAKAKKKLHIAPDVLDG